MGKKKINFMCTAFRDGFQSVYGARVLTKDFIPAVEAAVDAGINYFESGGGARFQSLYFYCNEDAFDMMDTFRKAAPNANLQTLARGNNVVGLDSQPSDIVKLHAELFKKHGVTTIRNFDALNDVNNLIYSGKCITEAGLKHQVCITMMELPPGCKGAHDSDFYMDNLKDILKAEIPFDSICFKDASGTATPAKVYDTIKAAKKMLPKDTLIHFHSHDTAGTCVTTYMSALEAGANQIDLSMDPVSGGTCQPDILTMWHALRGTDYDLDIDPDKIREAEKVFKDCMDKYFLPPEATAVEPLIPWSPMPGGALTANTQMLRDHNLMHKYSDIIHAMGDVVKKGGFGTSVTPVSQFYFQQAFNNVIMGEWEKIAEGYGKMVLGYFGKTPTDPDPEIVKLAQNQLELEPTKKTVLEINDEDETKGIKAAQKMLKDENLPTNDENIFIAATCKEKGIMFLKGEAELGIRLKEDELPSSPETSGNYSVTVDGKKYNVSVRGEQTIVNGRSYNTSIAQGVEQEIGEASPSSEGVPVESPMPGKVFKIVANEGSHVESGDTILILEAMKMETEVKAKTSGTITSIMVSVGDQVQGGDVLGHIGK